MPENQGHTIFAHAVEENANNNNNQPSEMEDHKVNQTVINTNIASSEVGSNNTSASDSFLDKDQDAKGIGTATEDPVLGMDLNKTKVSRY